MNIIFSHILYYEYYIKGKLGNCWFVAAASVLAGTFSSFNSSFIKLVPYFSNIFLFKRSFILSFTSVNQPFIHLFVPPFFILLIILLIIYTFNHPFIHLLCPVNHPFNYLLCPVNLPFIYLFVSC